MARSKWRMAHGWRTAIGATSSDVGCQQLPPCLARHLWRQSLKNGRWLNNVRILEKDISPTTR
eukprot:7641591-Alexandrium_andersonii.AAC.1